MLQKLQRKFASIFTGILAVTLVGIFIFIGVSTYNRMENSSYDTLTHYFTYKQTASRGSSMGSSSDTPITHSSIVLTLQFSHSGKFIGKPTMKIRFRFQMTTSAKFPSTASPQPAGMEKYPVIL